MTGGRGARALLAAAGLALTLGCAPAPAPADDEAAAAQRRTRVETGLEPALQVRGAPHRWSLAERMRRWGTPGVGIAVIEGGRLDWAAGYGVEDLTHGAPLTPGSRFMVGELSQPVASLTVLALAARGGFDLDADIHRYLHSARLPGRDGEERPLTIRHLLSHTGETGLARLDGYPPDAPRPGLDDLIAGRPPAQNPPLSLDAPPGRRWQFSSGGYIWLQRLLEDSSGRPYMDLAQEVVLSPLHMGDTTAAGPPAPGAPGWVLGHTADGRPLPDGWLVYPSAAAAGLWSTPRDLARLLLEIMNTASTGRGELIDADTVARMLTPYTPGWGMGFQVLGETDRLAIGHPGAPAGGRGILFGWVLRGQGAVVLTSGEGGDALYAEILRAIARVYGWPEGTAGERRTITLTPDQLDLLAGDYTLTDQVSLRLESTGGQLWAVFPGGGRHEVLAESETRHFLPETGAEIEVVLSAPDRVRELVIRDGGQRLVAVRVPPLTGR